MILLQAAMGAAFILLSVGIGVLTIGVPIFIFVGLRKKLRATNNNQPISFINKLGYALYYTILGIVVIGAVLVALFMLLMAIYGDRDIEGEFL